MNTLEKIIHDKRLLVNDQKRDTSIDNLKESEHYKRDTISLVETLEKTTVPGFIAEFKRRSPSKGDINRDANVFEIAEGYSKAGASGISVLTDKRYFGGYNKDLSNARSVVDCAILRKDFMVDPFQIHEAKSIGADVILLIAAALSIEEIIEFSGIAHDLGLEVLLEIHSLEELDDRFIGSIDILGVNNRNLKTFETNVDNSLEIYDSLPKEIVKISESGLSSMEEVNMLFNKGYRGFLIGEQFMKSTNPGIELEKFRGHIVEGS